MKMTMKSAYDGYSSWGKVLVKLWMTRLIVARIKMPMRPTPSCQTRTEIGWRMRRFCSPGIKQQSKFPNPSSRHWGTHGSIGYGPSRNCTGKAS